MGARTDTTMKLRNKAIMLAAAVLCALGAGGASVWARGEESSPPVGIDEHLGGQLPLDAVFRDETGQTTTLGQVIDGRPTVMALVYFDCPGICTPLLNGMVDVLNDPKFAMKPGADFQVVTVSFNPKDTPHLAAKKRDTYVGQMTRPFPKSAWRFLTGTQDNIDKLVKALGFKYKKSGDTFVHSGSIYAISPKGKIARYLYGVDYLPFDLEMALTEASQGKTGPTINKLLRYCFSYDPAGRRYTLAVTRLAGAGTLIGAMILMTVLTVSGRKRTKYEQELQQGDDNGSS